VKDKGESVSAEGRAELIEKLDSLIKTPYEIIDENWGIRPTTSDRKPMLGSSQDHPSVVIFNGFGTKGVSLAPFFSAQLADWLIDKGEIEPAVNVGRFY